MVYIVRIYDLCRVFWSSDKVSKKLSLFLIGVFLALSGLICLNAAGVLPPRLSVLVPVDPLQAVRLAFTLVLGMEVVALILAVADSVAMAASKQLEIMALIMIRDAFTDISCLKMPPSLDDSHASFIMVFVVSLSGLLLFIIREIFVKLQYIQEYSDMERYVNTKKCVSVFFLAATLITGLYDLYRMLFWGEETIFFHTFYSCLIFCDVLLVLIGQYFMPSFHATFRNSGYAVSALLMRIALGAPHYLGAIICTLAGLYLLGLAWAAARFLPVESAPPPSINPSAKLS